jgi:hypothetical protein
MKRSLLIFGLFTLFCLSVSAQTAPPTLVLDGETLLKNRQAKNSALAEIVKDADKIIKANKLFSVMNKQQVPPSGDKHDYMSQAPYWWADPSKPNGLPYIRRDGERNPELNKITDKEELRDMMDNAEMTAIAYFFTENEAYAKHSAELIRTWFLNEKTRMNPNLKFAQGIPGINTGRGLGLIETRELYRIIDAAILLQTSKSWTTDDHKSLKKWFADFAKWLIESDLGKDEAKAKNNHGTHYDAQLISFLIFSDQTELAKKQLETTKQRIKNQMEKDGSLPLELERTLSWDYSFMNLYGYFTIAILAEKLGVDLWNFETDGRGIKKAVEWLLPFAKGEKKWTHKQIKDREIYNTIKVFTLAAKKYNNNDYKDLAAKFANDEHPSALERLTK